MTLPSVPCEITNRGPWTALESGAWPGYCLGQTTALAGGRSPNFHHPESRLRFYRYLPVDSVHEARQVHGSDLAVTGPYSSCYRGVDGLFSARSGSLLTIRTADCYPVFVRDVSNPRFCLLHAGWRGLADGIISKALNNWFDGPVELILGAGIGASEYEVGEDVVHAFSETLGMDVESMKQRGILSGSCLDLKEIIAREADRADVTVRSIARFPSSTTAGNESPPLLSYRDDGTEDRMISWIFHRRR